MWADDVNSSRTCRESPFRCIYHPVRFIFLFSIWPSFVNLIELFLGRWTYRNVLGTLQVQATCYFSCGDHGNFVHLPRTSRSRVGVRSWRSRASSSHSVFGWEFRTNDLQSNIEIQAIIPSNQAKSGIKVSPLYSVTFFPDSSIAKLLLRMPSSSTSSTTSNVSPTSSAILSSSGKLSLSSSDIISSSPQHIYKLSSQYFLTKHFPEAANAITPLLKSQETRWKQKAWGLYLIILDNGLKFSDEQGRKVWGRQAWEKEVARVKESKLWDDLVESVGDISVVEAEVMMAMYSSSLLWNTDGLGFKFRYIMEILKLRRWR